MEVHRQQAEPWRVTLVDTGETTATGGRLKRVTNHLEGTFLRTDDERQQVGRLPDPRFWEGRRVLLTGHTGFKGSWLTLWLLQMGAEVTGVSLAPEAEPHLFTQLGLTQPRGHALPGRLHNREVDLLHARDLREVVEECRPEVVLHLAAQSLVRRGYREPLLTWQTNVIGTLQLLEALRQRLEPCAAVCVTTDKVYENHEKSVAFQEVDRLGGSDPYSSSKAAMELAVASWRASFCGSAPHQHPGMRLATARAGNVIGGGDWAEDRIVPDAIRALQQGAPLVVRQPRAIRPWQHVLEPLAGYLLLAEQLQRGELSEGAFNFGPRPSDSRSVAELVQTMLQHWPGQWQPLADAGQAPAESAELRLNSERARRTLGWQPRWGFEESVGRTVGWYRAVNQGAGALPCCLADLASYLQGDSVQVLQGAETLPEREAVELFTAIERSELQRERQQWLDVQMPSFVRGDEEESAEDLFAL